MTPAPNHITYARSRVAVLYTITGRIAPSTLSPAYRLGLFFTAVAMLVLPVIYIGLIVAVGYAVWWHLFADAWLLSGPHDALLARRRVLRSGDCRLDSHVLHG